MLAVQHASVLPRPLPKTAGSFLGLPHKWCRIQLAGAATVGALCASAARYPAHSSLTARAASSRKGGKKRKRIASRTDNVIEAASRVEIDDGTTADDPELEVSEVQAKLLRLAACCDRGQQGTPGLRRECEAMIAELESSQAAGLWDQSWADQLVGEWRLVYATEDPTRSSPFFWAFRKAMAGVKDPFPSRLLFGSEELSDNILTFTDNIPLKSVGVASQSFGNGLLISRVGVRVFLSGESTMTTTSRYAVKQTDLDRLLRIGVERTEVVGSSVAASLLQDYEAPTGEWLGDSAEVEARVTFLDDRLRVMRDAARPSACFVYARVL
mmetsp:Transcript_64102/g.119182  ORF Transcript_64102/g.119182 Transcript_64102/m.119182 type:complete len:326 (+) Transcript_64102:62-1039(+)